MVAANSAADYRILEGFMDAACLGSPVASIASNFAESCPQTRSRVACINSTHGTNFQFSDSSCTNWTRQDPFTVHYPACVPSLKRFVGNAIRNRCVTGSYTSPNSGLVSESFNSSTSCSQQPLSVVQYATDVCFPQDSGFIRASCEKAGFFIRSYSDAACSGSAAVQETGAAGCSLGNQSAFYTACYSPTSPSMNAASIVGAAVGGTLAVFAVGGAAVYFKRLRRSSDAKETAPLL